MVSFEEAGHGKDADGSLEDALNEYFGKAERILHKQHQSAIRLVMQNLESGGTQQRESGIARLSRENENLRARLSLHNGPGDAAAGSAAVRFSMGGKGKLRLTANGESGDLGTKRPVSQTKTSAPNPPLAAPPNLPAELESELEEEAADIIHSQSTIKSSNHHELRSTIQSNHHDLRCTVQSDTSLDFDGDMDEQMSDFKDREKRISAYGMSQSLGRSQYGAFSLLEVWRSTKQASVNLFQANQNIKLRRAKTHLESLRVAEVMEMPFGVAGSNSTMRGPGWQRKWVIHPYSPKRSFWDITSLLLVLWDMVMIPMGFFDFGESVFLDFMAWTTRLFWTADMPLSVISGFITSDGTIELRIQKICRKYLRSWFALDLLVVGVDWIELILSATSEGLGYARLGKASRVFRIIRMVRLLRLARMKEVANLLTERFNSEKLVIIIDMTKLMMMMLGVGHVLACFWYAIADSKSDGKSWLVYYKFKDTSIAQRYIMSLRWAMSQFAGGMDEVTPKCLEENFYAIFVYLTAFWSGAVFLSILTSSMTQWYIIGSQQAQQISILRRYLAQKGISKKLALRVQRNAQHAMAEQQRAMPEAAVVLIAKVSEPLKIELHFEMYAPNLTVHPFFHRYIIECPHIMRKVCHTAMMMSTVSYGDMIFNVGEMPAEPKMYIVSRGALMYTSMFDGENTPVLSGKWISEPTLWVQWVHRGTLAASEDCLLFCVLARQFQTIVGHFEHIGFDPRGYANTFVDCLNETDDATDLEIPHVTEKFKRKNEREQARFATSFILKRSSSHASVFK